MGQAKQRGTFEQRKAAAIEEQKQQAKRFRPTSRYTSKKTSMMLAAMLGMALSGRRGL